MMTPLINDGFISDDSFYSLDTAELPTLAAVNTSSREIHILEEKLSIPQFDWLLPRPRLDALLEKSLSQFNATLISGRSGTGKTALAADFASNQNRVAWYSVESPEIDWAIFSRYFSASLVKVLNDEKPIMNSHAGGGDVSLETIAEFLTDIFARIESRPDQEPLLFVLDDLHHIFDASWFGEFFNLLIRSLGEKTHLLLTCRSRPPSPLWRLRSKQMLNVIDEKVLAFNFDETTKFFHSIGQPEKAALKAYAQSFGRIAKIKQIAARTQR